MKVGMKECEDDIHTPEMGTWESSRTPKNSEFDYRGQNTLRWDVLYTVGKVLKCKCQKWLCMSHESNWQFDSWPLKVRNRPNHGVCRWNVTHRWKARKECYKFALNLIPIGGLSKELWSLKIFRYFPFSFIILREPTKLFWWHETTLYKEFTKSFWDEIEYKNAYRFRGVLSKNKYTINNELEQ
jgi:hypothetical protein